MPSTSSKKTLASSIKGTPNKVKSTPFKGSTNSKGPEGFKMVSEQKKQLTHIPTPRKGPSCPQDGSMPNVSKKIAFD